MPHTHRYRVNAEGRPVALCFYRIYAHLLRLALSVAFSKDAPHPAPSVPLMDRFDAAIDRLWKGQCATAKT